MKRFEFDFAEKICFCFSQLPDKPVVLLEGTRKVPEEDREKLKFFAGILGPPVNYCPY